MKYLFLFIFLGFKPVVDTRQNIVIIIIDDMGYEVPSYSGGQSYQTHTLDSLANVSFISSACHGTPSCTPSRMELLSGRYNNVNYFTNRHMDTSVRTIGNMAKSAGYVTGFYGKWQLDGGDYIRTKFGFDRYSVLFPYGNEDTGKRYKNPLLYSNSNYYNPQGYCDDIMIDSIKEFVKSNKTKNFLCVFSMSLVHTPFQPTPDDTEYKNFTFGSDVKYFPSMVKYADKEIGRLITFLNSKAPNTTVIIVGDNGTSQQVNSIWNGQVIGGAKKTTINWATNVPFIVNKIGEINPRQTDALISFTDIMPSLADIMQVQSLPTDGHSFYTESPYWYLYWGDISNKTESWAMRYNANRELIKLYKLKDSMYNTTLDSYETMPIMDSNYNYLKQILWQH